MKFFKWILGLIGLIGGAIAMFVPKSKNEKVKEIEGKIKTVDDILKQKEKENNNIKESLKNKKNALEEIKKQRESFGVERKSSDEAAEFLKKYAKDKENK